jgi:hypothetical protein
MAEQADAGDPPSRRNGRLKISLPFDEAVKAALRVKPSPKTKPPVPKKGSKK